MGGKLSKHIMSSLLGYGWNMGGIRWNMGDIHLRKMNITPLAILVIKWPFSKGRGG